MNGTLVFVLCVVAVVMCARVFEVWIKQKKHEPENPAELDETLSKIDVLEERIKVLERIITENRFDLKREIDSL
jgi:high-affinity nickel permease